MTTDETTTATTEATPPRSEARYPLAFDVNGNPVAVPPQAVAWRVRRGGGRRGRPRNVFNAENGRQLEIALGASLQDLIDTNVPPDRYLLYPVDAEGQIIAGFAAVTEVPADDEAPSDEAEADDRQGLRTDNPDPLIALAAGQQEVIKAMSDHMSRSLGSAVSGYAPVRPTAPPAPAPAPMVMEHPPAPPAAPQPNMLESILAKPEQLVQLGMLVKQVFDMVKGAAGGGAAAAGSGP